MLKCVHSLTDRSKRRPALKLGKTFRASSTETTKDVTWLKAHVGDGKYQTTKPLDEWVRLGNVSIIYKKTVGNNNKTKKKRDEVGSTSGKTPLTV